jgi:hypothetical protein
VQACPVRDRVLHRLETYDDDRLAIFDDDRLAIFDDDRQAICDDDRQAICDDDRQAICDDDRQANFVSRLISFLFIYLFIYSFSSAYQAFQASHETHQVRLLCCGRTRDLVLQLSYFFQQFLDVRAICCCLCSYFCCCPGRRSFSRSLLRFR